MRQTTFAPSHTESPASTPNRRQAVGMLSLVLAGGLLAACGGGGDGGPMPLPVVPTLVIKSNVVGTIEEPFTVAFVFSGAVSGFGADRFLLNGGRIVAGSFTQVTPSEYTVQITPFANGQGTVSIEVYASSYKDSTGTVSNTQAYNFSQAYDTRTPEPWVTFTDSQPGLFASGAVTVTMTFNLDVGTSFTIDDLFVTGATVSAFTQVSATVYTVLVTPLAGARNMTIEIPAGAFTAAVPNGVANARPWDWFKFISA